MALLKNKQYLNTAILTCKNIHRIFSVEHYSKILPLLFKLHHIRFMLNSNKGPACYGKDMLNCQTVSYRTSLQRAMRRISTQKLDHIFFLIKILWNPHLFHVLQTQKDLGLSDLPKFTKCFLPLSVTPASTAFGLKTL